MTDGCRSSPNSNCTASLYARSTPNVWSINGTKGSQVLVTVRLEKQVLSTATDSLFISTIHGMSVYKKRARVEAKGKKHFDTASLFLTMDGTFSSLC